MTVQIMTYVLSSILSIRLPASNPLSKYHGIKIYHNIFCYQPVNIFYTDSRTLVEVVEEVLTSWMRFPCTDFRIAFNTPACQGNPYTKNMQHHDDSSMNNSS